MIVAAGADVSSGIDDGGRDASVLCWICGSDADSAEHKTKRSDLKAVFGRPTQAQPLFFHDQTRKNRRVGSLDAKLLKSPGRICHFCNSTRTQPHDRAWEALSKFLHDHPEITPGSMLRGNRVFPYNTRQQMLDVHLFFAKLFGCLILEGDLRIDAGGFSSAIILGRAHPHFHLKFGRPSTEERITAGRSDVWAWPTTINAPATFATWFYCLPHVWVNVMFAAPGEKREGRLHRWSELQRSSANLGRSRQSPRQTL